MTKKKQIKEWKIALIFTISVSIIASIILRIIAFLISWFSPEFLYITDFLEIFFFYLTPLFFSLFLAIKIISRYFNKKYTFNKEKFIKFSTIYFCSSLFIFTLINHYLTIPEFLPTFFVFILLFRVSLFYFFSKRYLKNDEQILNK